MIHFIASPEAASTDLPLILAGKRPSRASDDGIGSQDYSRKPEIVLSGLGYFNEIIDDLRATCQAGHQGPGVPWVRGGLSEAQFNEMMATSPPAEPSKQAPLTAEKAKSKILEIVQSGQLGVDGVFKWH